MKREVEVVRMAPLVKPATVWITGKTRQDVSKRAGRGVARGQFGAVGEIVHTRSGYAAKATLIPRTGRRRKADVPAWSRVLVRVSLALSAVTLAVAALLAALASLFGALVSIPWLTVLGGGLVLLFFAALIRKAVSGGKTITQNNFF